MAGGHTNRWSMMQYRAEIDGLRAIAVLSVILFHAHLPWMKGGFAGVDVFFVLSGYLITGLLLEDLQAGRFSILAFYERRARRILPALVAMALTTFGLGFWLLTPQALADLSGSLGAVALFLSNFYFASQAGYFGADADGLALLHTWSLAIEEQFYLVFPVALYLMRRWPRRRLAVVLALVGLASLAIAEIGGRIDPDRNFFFTLSRAWELLAGALVALARDLPGRRQDDRLAALGLAAILASLVFPVPATVPGLACVLPVAGTALVLHHASARGRVGRALAWGPLRGIGLISYSAYLWHQPVFVFARHLTPDPLTGLQLAGLILLTLALAALSWRFVEQPFRRRPRPALAARPALFAASIAATAGLLALGGAGHVAQGWPALWAQRHPDRVDDLALITRAETRAALPESDCRFVADDLGAKTLARIESCRATHGKGVLVLGDSHAIDLYASLVRLDRAPFVVGVVQGGCRPHSPAEGCLYDAIPGLAAQGAFEMVLYEQAGFYLFSSPWYPEGDRRMFEGVGLTDPVPPFQVNARFVQAVADYLAGLSRHVPVVWLGPRQEPHVPLALVLERGCEAPVPIRPGLARTFDRLDTAIRGSLAGSGVHFLPQNTLFDLQWPRDFGGCDGLWWRDGDHFSDEGGMHFGARADVVAAARRLVTAQD